MDGEYLLTIGGQQYRMNRIGVLQGTNYRVMGSVHPSCAAILPNVDGTRILNHVHHTLVQDYRIAVAFMRNQNDDPRGSVTFLEGTLEKIEKLKTSEASPLARAANE